ncbi:MAG: D-alanyl-D-alanine carboxypeptidase [Devosiaceae bacterium]|nr:D-alanyl-D-alanine carboxypeptidase [Devosiaceae bacterium MH13]
MLRLIGLIVLFAWSASPAAATIAETIRALAPGGLVHVVGEDGETLVSQNADQPFVPASVAKIATAWMAMEVLGPEYRFETRFFVDANRVLYVRGGGDPFLVSEELAVIAQRLVAAAGTAPFSAMVLDTSHFPSAITIPGIVGDSEAYNALNAALAANFNTIHAVRSGDSVRSAEPQTPITPLAISQFRQRAPNGQSRISLAQQDPSLAALYAGELLVAFIRQAGSDVRGPLSLGATPAGLQPVYVHRQSRPLSQIVRVMLDFSNNYIANQIFLQAGVGVGGSPVSLERSQATLAALLETRGLRGAVSMVEGSGISRQNRMTAQGLAALLVQFAPYAELMDASPRGSRYKTGTLDSVSTLAGYARTRQNGLVRFVIALPGGSGRLRFAILEAIEEEL